MLREPDHRVRFERRLPRRRCAAGARSRSLRACPCRSPRSRSVPCSTRRRRPRRGRRSSPVANRRAATRRRPRDAMPARRARGPARSRRRSHRTSSVNSLPGRRVSVNLPRTAPGSKRTRTQASATLPSACGVAVSSIAPAASEMPSSSASATSSRCAGIWPAASSARIVTSCPRAARAARGVERGAAAADDDEAPAERGRLADIRARQVVGTVHPPGASSGKLRQALRAPRAGRDVDRVVRTAQMREVLRRCERVAALHLDAEREDGARSRRRAPTRASRYAGMP